MRTAEHFDESKRGRIVRACNLPLSHSCIFICLALLSIGGAECGKLSQNHFLRPLRSSNGMEAEAAGHQMALTPARASRSAHFLRPLRSSEADELEDDDVTDDVMMVDDDSEQGWDKRAGRAHFLRSLRGMDRSSHFLRSLRSPAKNSHFLRSLKRAGQSHFLRSLRSGSSHYLRSLRMPGQAHFLRSLRSGEQEDEGLNENEANAFYSPEEIMDEQQEKRAGSGGHFLRTL